MRNKRNKNKGQAALEFMMTYGWAMLLLTALVAGLVYVMPHPGTVTANKCLFGSAIPCIGSQLSNSTLTIVLRNGMGQSIYNVSANVTMPKQVGCNISNSTIKAEERIILTCNNTLIGTKADARIRVALTYKKVRGGYDQSIIGELYAKYN